PIPARRERSAGGDFRAVGDSRALVLADFEEAVQEQLQPALDGGKVIVAALVSGDVRWPVALALVVPSLVSRESHFAGAEAVAGDVVDVEILQLIGPDLGFGALAGFALSAGHQLG